MPATEPAISRLSIPLRFDGSIAVETLRASTRDKLASVLPALNRELGQAPSAPTFPPELTAAVVGVIGQVEYILVAKASGAPRDVLQAVVPWTAEERDAIEPVLGRVLAKYVTGAISKYQDEIGLAVVLLTVTQGKIIAARQLARRPADVSPIRPAPAPSAPAEEKAGDE